MKRGLAGAVQDAQAILATAASAGTLSPVAGQQQHPLSSSSSSSSLVGLGDKGGGQLAAVSSSPALAGLAPPPQLSAGPSPVPRAQQPLQAGGVNNQQGGAGGFLQQHFGSEGSFLQAAPSWGAADTSAVSGGGINSGFALGQGFALFPSLDAAFSSAAALPTARGTSTVASKTIGVGGLNRPENACMVCLSGKNSIALLPCRHKCVCWDCSEGIMNGATADSPPVCPICRVAIQFKVDVDAPFY